MDQHQDTSNPFLYSSIVDVKQSVRNYIWTVYRTRVIWGAIAAVIWWSLLLWLGWYTNDVMIALYMIPVGIFGYFYNRVYQKAHEAFFRQFATMNKYAFTPTADPTSVHAASLKRGHSQKMYNIVSGTIHHSNFQLFNFEFTIGSGKHKRTYASTVFELDFDEPMPHMMLIAKKGERAMFSLDTTGLQEIMLEGDFHKYFWLYMTKGSQIPVLSIFAPDFMHDMIIRHKKYDIEFINDKIYIFDTRVVTTAHELSALYSMATELSNRMHHVLKTFSL
jgi:hypothetical protein